MHTTSFGLLPCIFLVLFFCWFICSDACTFTLTNNCPVSKSPGTLAGSRMPRLPMMGFVLELGQTARIPSVPGWSGRIWAWMGCTVAEGGMGTCLTEDCEGRFKCAGNGATPPTSLFEIMLGQGTDKDFYDVGIMDGYNLPLVVVPQGVYGECNASGCTSDINLDCPKELQVVGGNNEDGSQGVIACRGACKAFGLDHYCSGQFANPMTCRPSYYSALFKRACLTAYSYAFDDGTSTFACKVYDYRIIFCPDMEG